MDSLHRFVSQSTINSEEVDTPETNPTFIDKPLSEVKKPTFLSSLTTSTEYKNHPHSYTSSLPNPSSNINSIINITEQQPESESTRSKPKRRTCYQCGEAGHTTTNCPHTQINHNLPKRSSGKKLTSEEIQLVVHCYFKCEEERLSRKISIKADSVRRTAFYLGMSKNTVARLVREYAQTGELPVSKARLESNKPQTAMSSLSRKKTKRKEIDSQKMANIEQILTSETGNSKSLISEPSLQYSHSVYPISSIPIPTATSISPLPPVSNLQGSSPIIAVSSQSLMGIHEMLTNSSSSFFESDAALSNIMNPVEHENETVFNSHVDASDVNPRI